MTYYTDAATVAAALNMNPEATVFDSMAAGATTLVVPIVPSTWTVGMYLALDYFNKSIREVVQIVGAPNGNCIPITPTLNAHVVGSPIAECNGANEWIPAATQAINDYCRVFSGFGQETITESVKSYIDNDGWLIVPCSKPEPQVASVTAFSYQSTPADSPVVVQTPLQAWTEGTYMLRVGGVCSPYIGREIMVTLTYTGGYSPIPDDIQRATVALAARFYKEKDSGFSDAIGSSDLGIMTYKKDIPADVKMMLKPRVRYV